MRLIIEPIAMDNAAFEGVPEGDLSEPCYVLDAIVSAMRIFGQTSGVCNDHNGNKVGSWRIEE